MVNLVSYRANLTILTQHCGGLRALRDDTKNVWVGDYGQAWNKKLQQKLKKVKQILLLSEV